MYKDEAKQREANRLANRKYRQKGITEGITQSGITEKGITDSDYPEGVIPGVMTEDQRTRFPNIPLPFGPAYYRALKEQNDRQAR